MMLEVPAGRLVVVMVAIPVELIVDVPSASEPAKKLTLPVGVPVVFETTVSVSVTLAPAAACVVDAMSVSVTPALATLKTVVAVLCA
jgi:hypothetical protein